MALLSLRVFLIARKYCLSSNNTAPPSELFTSLSTLSEPWITTASRLIPRSIFPHSIDSLGFIAYNALFETQEAIGHWKALKTLDLMKHNDFLDLFNAQEAISTMLATSSMMFVKYAGDTNDFIQNKICFFDIMYNAGKINDFFSRYIHNLISAKKLNSSQSSELCEAALKATEAASKCLLWGWKVSPWKILELVRKPNMRTPNFTFQTLTEGETLAFAPGLHQAVLKTLIAAWICCPDIDSPSSPLAQKVGAVSLKAFFALETKPDPGWALILSRVNFPVQLKADSYELMPYFLRNPRAFSKPSLIFKNCIAPILAGPEPFLENAANHELGTMNVSLMMHSQERIAELFSIHAHYPQAADDIRQVMSELENEEVMKNKAVARAHAMETLACGYVGCKTISLPGEKSGRCGGCEAVKYCERCQKADWKAHHKVACKEIAARRV